MNAVAQEPPPSGGTAYVSPVHVQAELDPRVGRWTWLVKWLLLLPHYVVLFGLWMAALVLSVVAFFAILLTGRYPRSLFDFNLGVLRWTWRVSFYGYGALGTDRYPPFTLHDVPDYPAHLEVAYPERLSRRLVVVKSWLLALPHLLVVAILVGGTGYAASRGGDGRVLGTGLIGLLVLVAGVALLFTGRYPASLFDFILGLDRWVLRVAAYVFLMTDVYPPFRLDQGGGEGAGRGTLAPEGGPEATVTPARSGWTAGRIAAVVVTGLLVPLWLGLAGAGFAAAVADVHLRDELGFVMSPGERLASDTYAITSTNLDVRIDEPARGLVDHVVGDVRLTVTASKQPVFIGLAHTDDVDRYLGTVAHATVTESGGSGAPRYVETGEGAPQGLPGTQRFWVASSEGTGQQGISWRPVDGDWTLVLMNADGSRRVGAQVAVGASIPALGTVSAVLLSVGLTGLAISLVVLVLVVRGSTAGRRPTG